MIRPNERVAVIRAPTFRAGLYGGLLVAVVLGLYLFQLWDTEQQIRLHTAHLMTALEKNNWSAVGEFLDPSYSDQWGHDRAMLLERLQQVLPYARHLHLRTETPVIHAANGEGEWSARVTVEADPNEVSAMIQERVNPLQEPFNLKWRHASWKPWDWKLISVTNPALDLPDRAF